MGRHGGRVLLAMSMGKEGPSWCPPDYTSTPSSSSSSNNEPRVDEGERVEAASDDDDDDDDVENKPAPSSAVSQYACEHVACHVKMGLVAPIESDRCPLQLKAPPTRCRRTVSSVCYALWSHSYLCSSHQRGKALWCCHISVVQ